MVRWGVRGRRGSRPGLGRPAGHRRHDARLRPLPPVRHGAAARLREPLRDRRPRRVARRPRGAGAGSGGRAAPAAGLGRAGSGGHGRAGRQRAAGRPGRCPGAGGHAAGPRCGHDRAARRPVRAGPRGRGPCTGPDPAVAGLRADARGAGCVDRGAAPRDGVRRDHRLLHWVRPAGRRPGPDRAGQADRVRGPVRRAQPHRYPHDGAQGRDRGRDPERVPRPGRRDRALRVRVGGPAAAGGRHRGAGPGRRGSGRHPPARAGPGPKIHVDPRL